MPYVTIPHGRSSRRARMGRDGPRWALVNRGALGEGSATAEVKRASGPVIGASYDTHLL